MRRNAELDVALMNAAETGDAKRVEMLLQAGASPNSCDILSRVAVLQASACLGHLAIVKVLLRYGADINLVSGDAPGTALESAAVAGRAEVVKWLLENGAQMPVGTVGDELIEEVSKAGDLEIASLLRGTQGRQLSK